MLLFFNAAAGVAPKSLDRKFMNRIVSRREDCFMLGRSLTRSLHDCYWEMASWRFRVAVLVAASVWLAGCGKSEKAEAKGEADRSSPGVSVVVTPVLQKTVPILSELTARTDANDSVDIRARVKAFLLTQNYAEGTMVKAGQVLFTLDGREYEAQLLQAKAQLAKANADLA